MTGARARRAARVMSGWVGLAVSVGVWLVWACSCVMSQARRGTKRKLPPLAHGPTAARAAIDANWAALLATGRLAGEEGQGQGQEQAAPGKTRYAGTFRRARRRHQAQMADTAGRGAALPDLSALELEAPRDNVLTRIASNCPAKLKHTKFIAMDCEMVGIGRDSVEHMIARVSLVNKFGDCIYDKFVKAREEVTDYRTKISGIRKEDMLNGEEFTTVQKEVAEILRGKILVGHSLKNDLAVLFLSHPKRNIRDTSRYKPFRKITQGSTPSLKRLAKEILGVEIQSGEHSSVEDARAAMKIYCTVARKWEETTGGRH